MSAPTGHACPGGCGDRVPDRLFACRSDWARLPRDLQRPVTDTAGKSLFVPERLAAVQDARRWYRENAR